MPMTVCPDPEELARFAVGGLDDAAIERLGEHLSLCEACRRTADAAFAASDLAHALGDTPNTVYTKEDGLQRAKAALAPGGRPTDDTVTKAGPEEDDASAAPPEFLGPYRVVGTLGRGGMGVVYAAEDPQLQRRVAVKVMKTRFAANAVARRRFLQEARSAAKLSHDHIVPIYQVGEERGVPFIAMPLLQGENLHDLLKAAGALSPRRIIDFGAQIADGLAAAHDAGLIHRDIKPANIWVEPVKGGRVKILDFGLARGTTEVSGLTQTGVILGTPEYMAPEQAMEAPVDHRCDLFSLGAVLYKMATGATPFPGRDTMSILMALATKEPVPPRTLNPLISHGLSAFILTLLAKDPAARPATAEAVSRALAALSAEPAADTVELKSPLAETEPAAPAVRPARRAPVFAVLAGLLLLVAAAGAYQLVFKSKDGTLVVEVDGDADVRFKNGRVELYDEAGAFKYAVEPGARTKAVPPGNYLVKVVGADGLTLDTERFEMRKAGKVTVRVTADAPRVAKVDPPRVEPTIPAVAKPLVLPKGTWEPGPAANVLPGLIPAPAVRDGVGRWQVVPASAAGFGQPAWSPDGRWLAVPGADVIRIYDAKTGQLAHVAPAGAGVNEGLRWSPDSKWIQTGGRNNLRFVAADGTPGKLSAVQHADVVYGWNPKHAVFASMTHGVRDRIQLADPTVDKPVEVVANQQLSGKVVWRPDGEALLVVREDKTAQVFGRDGKPGAKLAGAVLPAVVPAWTANGDKIAALTSATDVGVWAKDGTATATVFKHPNPIKRLWWRPDGKRLVAADAAGILHIWHADGTFQGIVETKTPDADLTWAADGEGFFSADTYWPATAAKGVPIGEFRAGVLVSPDGKRYAFVRRGLISVRTLNDGKPTEIGTVFQTRDGAPVWSPDGRELAHADDNGVTVYDAADPAKFRRMGNGAVPGPFVAAAFSPAGDRLALGSAVGHVVICDAAGRVVKILQSPGKVGVTLDDGVHALNWSPDGRRLAVVSGLMAVAVYDTLDGKLLAATTLPGVIRSPGSAVFAPGNADHLLLIHPDATAVWRWTVEKEPLQKYPGLGRVDVSPDGKRLLATAAGSGHYANDPVAPAVVAADLKTRTPIGRDELAIANFRPAPALLWHPDGKHLIAPGPNVTLRTPDGKVVREFKQVADAKLANIELLALTPDGKSALLFSDGRHYLLGLDDQSLTRFDGITGHVRVTPDGKRLVAVEGVTVKYWGIETKTLEQIVLMLPDGQYAVFSPAGELLDQSPKAADHLRYAVEDKTGRLTVRDKAP